MWIPRASGWRTDPSVHPQAGRRKNRMPLVTEYEESDLCHWPRAREMVGKLECPRPLIRYETAVQVPFSLAVGGWGLGEGREPRARRGIALLF